MSLNNKGKNTRRSPAIHITGGGGGLSSASMKGGARVGEREKGSIAQRQMKTRRPPIGTDVPEKKGKWAVAPSSVRGRGATEGNEGGKNNKLKFTERIAKEAGKKEIYIRRRSCQEREESRQKKR